VSSDFAEAVLIKKERSKCYMESHDSEAKDS
jgi:hypothetical protein